MFQELQARADFQLSLKQIKKNVILDLLILNMTYIYIFELVLST